MIGECANLGRFAPDCKPPGFGLTFVWRAPDGDGSGYLLKVREAWAVIAGWGRWCDEEGGTWPDSVQCLDALPRWLRSAVSTAPEGAFDSWLDDLYDREWILWSAAASGDRVKIDVSCEGMPVSTWMLDFVLQAAGGEPIYKGDWVAWR